MKKADEELRRAARSILAELDRAAATQGSLETDLAEMPDEFDYSDTTDTVYQLKRYRALRAAEISGNNILTDTEMSAPRTTRRQFLQQRIERRMKRDAGQNGGGALDGEAVEADVKKSELTDAGMPARLSEVYRRDARRYDGPFERY